MPENQECLETASDGSVCGDTAWKLIPSPPPTLWEGSRATGKNKYKISHEIIVFGAPEGALFGAPMGPLGPMGLDEALGPAGALQAALLK